MFRIACKYVERSREDGRCDYSNFSTWNTEPGTFLSNEYRISINDLRYLK